MYLKGLYSQETYCTLSSVLWGHIGRCGAVCQLLSPKVARQYSIEHRRLQAGAGKKCSSGFGLYSSCILQDSQVRGGGLQHGG